ncbi:hypothetical protein M5E87_17950 [Flavonifractor plautii]|nr:hypothetical protein M5E87_17950 [Flavonifractor plautii]
MNRKEQQFLRQRQTTRQLMGVTRLTEHGAVCGRDELLFYLLRPDNLSILSPKGIRGRVRALTGLLQGMASLELLALDSRESFLKNKQYYQRRLEEEPSPALRELLRQDMEHLDARQSSTAASREFVLVCLTGQQGRRGSGAAPAIGEADPGSRLSRLPGRGTGREAHPGGVLPAGRGHRAL